jgi:nucleoside-diphosphate-sugar epimerase
MKMLLVVQLLLLIAWTQAEDKGFNVLVFGGNGFIGSTTVDKILQKYPDAHITIVNRHNWYWDSDTRIKPRVAKIMHCDREKNITNCGELKAFLESEKYFDVVIDFSAYSGQVVRDASPYLKHKVGLYVLISTDSVYDACEKSHEEFSREEDCVQPETDEQKEALYAGDTYAYRKRQAEDAIVEQRLQDGGFNFVILRLPDVIGPRDGTHRWWIYQLWAKLAPEIPEQPVRVPSFLEDWQMSFVYVDDVADVIVDLFNAPPQVRDQVMNLAWPETWTVLDLIKAMEEVLSVENEIVLNEDRKDQFYLYPSVRKGPIAVTKAESLIGWKPTPWNEAVEKTVNFFEAAMTDDKFLDQKNEIIQIVCMQVYPGLENKVYDALEKLYDIDLKHFKGHDEL